MELSTAWTLVFLFFCAGLMIGFKDGKAAGIRMGNSQLKSCNEVIVKGKL